MQFYTELDNLVRPSYERQADSEGAANSVCCVRYSAADNNKQTMTAINCYGIDTSLKTVEHGPVNKEQALQIVDKFSAMQVGLYGSGEEVVSKSMFGFSIDVHKFLEIAMETESRFRVKLEMPGGWWSVYQREITIDGLDKLHEIVEHFFTMILDDFKQYFETIPSAV